MQVGRAQARATNFEESGAYMQDCVQDSILCIFLKVISFQEGKVADPAGTGIKISQTKHAARRGHRLETIKMV